MDRSELTIVRKVLADSRDVIDRTLEDNDSLSMILSIADTWSASLRTGGKILLCGNGGSAADAQHIAGELVSRFLFDRAPLAGLALTVDTSVLTAIGNDYGYEHTFSRQVTALGRSGDVLVGISTSGSSPNIIAALRAAKEAGMVTIGFTGSGGDTMSRHCDLVFHAPSTSTPLIQQIHITVGHIICQLVEQTMFGAARVRA